MKAKLINKINNFKTDLREIKKILKEFLQFCREEHLMPLIDMLALLWGIDLILNIISIIQ